MHNRSFICGASRRNYWLAQRQVLKRFGRDYEFENLEFERERPF